MKTLLVHPQVRAQDKPRHICYGIGILANIIRDKHEVAICDMNIQRMNYNSEDLYDVYLMDCLKVAKWDFIGVGGLSSQYKDVKKILPRARKTNPQATILAGGDDATFTGTIDRDAIRRVVQANIKQIKACYERALNKDPGLYGKISIQWTIGPGGRVLEASTKTTTMNSPEVENCAVNRLKTWKFPEPPADQVAVVSYPFVFQAQE